VKFLLILLIVMAMAFVIAGCSSTENIGPKIINLDPLEFSKVISDKDVFVVDVHTPEQEHIRGTDAVIAYNELEGSSKLPSDKNTPIAVYCRSGSMSSEATQTLKDRGYTQIYNLVGGAKAWKAEGMEFDEIESSNKRVEVQVFKSPNCGCCIEYVAELKERDFSVVTVKTLDMVSVKVEHGVPKSMESCHTAIIEGYFVEGHVPIEAVDKLLTERPDIDGIAMPGMPSGSPGMPGNQREPFVVYSVTDGEVSEFIRT
jgi:rhodanese-related sulfurtransferase